jgi:hypothetical protein
MNKLSIYSVLAAVFAILGGGLARAQTTGTWELYPEQTTSYATAVQQPINADGTSNFKFTGKSVIPIKFSLSTAPGPVIFQSIGSDGSDATFPGTNDYSFLSFTPSVALTFNQITNLSAVYNFSEGNCHGGSLRWSVRVSPTQSVFIYYGGHPNFTDCTTAGPTINQSGITLINRPEARYDTSQIGGTFYDTYANAQDLVGSTAVIRASLVLDSGWGGDQVISPLSNVTVNDNTFVPLTGGSSPTCNLPPATIQITQLSGSPTGPVNEPISIQPADNNSEFRIVDCKYMYNLATSSLPGTGRYKVEVVIDGTPATGAALFDLR